MNPSIFSENAPGTLREIFLASSKDWAFIPHPLPAQWEPPPRILHLLVSAREELARLDGVGKYMPNYNLLLRPLQRREALGSSSLEGTYATPQQLLLFEIDPIKPKSTYDPVSSQQEVWNYNRALDLALEILKTKPLTLNVIRDIHRVLLSGVRGSQRDPGNFRRTQVHIGSDKRFIPPPHQEMMDCLFDLEKFIHSSPAIDTLILCFMVHYQFETIHPFLDGNGRVGRLLLSLMIYQQCNLSKPWLYLSAFFDRYRDEYINLLFQVSIKGNWNDWIIFCLRGTIEQSKDALDRLDKLLQLRTQYQERINQVGGNVRLIKLLDYLFESPVITVSQFAKMSNIHYNTARADLERLVKVNILVESDVMPRSKVYIASNIFDIAYSD
jgi:Fic family protein